MCPQETGDKFETKVRKIAEKINESKIIHDWLKIDGPNVKKKGIREDNLKEALANNATINNKHG